MGIRDDDERYQDEEIPKGKIRFVESRNSSVFATYKGKFVVQFPERLKVKDIELTPVMIFNESDKRDQVFHTYERLYCLGYNEKAFLKAERARASKERGSRLWRNIRRSHVQAWTVIKNMPGGAISVIYAVWKHFSH